MPSAVFLSVDDIGGRDGLTDEQRDLIEMRIAQFFVPPSPFRLSVFAGPALVRGLRISAPGDSVGLPRAASVVGTYGVDVTEHGATGAPEVVRSSLVRGLDSALVRAIRAAINDGPAFRSSSGDRWRLRVRVTTDSIDGARRLAQGTFPRLRIRDATPRSKTRLAFPDEARADSLDHGEAVLRFVVDRDGRPALETVEVVRSSAMPFLRAALAALADQQFNAATILGCPVAQLVEYSFVFDDVQRPPARGTFR